MTTPRETADHAELLEDALEALQIIDAFPSNQGEVEGAVHVHRHSQSQGTGRGRMTDRIAMIVGYGVMWLSASAVVALAAGVLMQLIWVRVIRPVHLMADYQEWRRAKASGAWQWPRIVTPTTPPDGEGRHD